MSPDLASRTTILRNLGCKLTFVVLVKVAIILLAAFTVFGAANRVQVNGDTMTDQFFGFRPSSPPTSP